MSESQRIGVSAGVSILIWESGAVSCLGALPTEALREAERRLTYHGGLSACDAELIRKWILLMRIKIEKQEFERRLNQAADPRLEYAKSILPDYAYPTAEEMILEQERKKLEP